MALLCLTAWRLYLAPTPPRLVRVTGKVMGTTYTVKVVARTREQQSDAARSALAQRVKGALDAVNTSMSTYRPDSELSRFNALAAGEKATLSAAMVDVMTVAERVHHWSNGAFDTTVGPLVDRWGFGANQPSRALPTPDELAELRQALGHDQLVFDPEAGTLEKKRAELRVDLSAIAKGYGVDRVAGVLRAGGWTDFMVEVGGEIRVAGQTEAGRSWRLAVERPTEAGRAIQEVVALDSDQAMATSGDYRNFTVVDGVRYSHTIDPTTGRPVTHALASVSVVADTCVEADAMATALAVLGPDRGYTLAAAHNMAALFLVGSSGDLEVRATDPWVKLRVPFPQR
ncbi:MAG: FAD:protein FMN transferase [Myxococcota bacterium]